MSETETHPKHTTREKRPKDTELENSGNYGLREYMWMAPKGTPVDEILEAHRQREIPDEWRESQ